MPQESLRKRPARFAIAAVAAVGALALAGCTAPVDPGPVAPDEPVTLRISVQAGAVESPYGLMAKKYSEEFPNVTFEIEEVPNEQFGEVLRTQLQAGNAPDIFYTTGGSGNPHSVIPLAEAGYLLPLTDTVANELVTGASRALFEFEGDIWSQPLDFVPITNNYNLTLAEELGIELPFESVDDVFDACEVAVDAGKTFLMIAGSTVPNNGLTTLQMAATRVYADQPDWNELRAAGEVSFVDTPGWKESMEQLVELSEAGCFQPGFTAGVVQDNVPAVAGGLALGAFAPGGSTGDMKRLNPDNVYVATTFPAPEGSDAPPLMFASPSNTLAINVAASEEKQAAALAFFAWLAEPANADELAGLSGNLSIRAGAGAELPEQYRFIEDYFTNPDSNIPLANLGWPSAEIYNVLGTGMQGVYTGQTTIDAVLEAMDAAWDAAQ